MQYSIVMRKDTSTLHRRRCPIDGAQSVKREDRCFATPPVTMPNFEIPDVGEHRTKVKGNKGRRKETPRSQHNSKLLATAPIIGN